MNYTKKLQGPFQLSLSIISELALEIILLTVITATVTEREWLDAPPHSAVTSEVLSSKYAVSKR